jgi:hypothetical protein
MLITKTSLAVMVCVAFAAGIIGHAVFQPTAVHAAGNRVFEIRTYTTPPGKLDALNARFRDHTIKLFDKHGMKSIGYWIPQDPALKDNTLIYVLAHDSREAAAANWKAFQSDPDWVKAKADSEKDGRLTTKTESVFVDPTDYSPLK